MRIFEECKCGAHMSGASWFRSKELIRKRDDFVQRHRKCLESTSDPSDNGEPMGFVTIGGTVFPDDGDGPLRRG